MRRSARRPNITPSFEDSANPAGHPRHARQQHLCSQLLRREPLHRCSDSGIVPSRPSKWATGIARWHMLLFLLLPWMFFKLLTSTLPVLAWAG
jgi:hypothetical protein